MGATLRPTRPNRSGHYSRTRTTAQATKLRRDDLSTRRYRNKRAFPSSYPFLAYAGSCPGNCPGMEETTGAPSSCAVCYPRRLRASSRDGGGVMNRPPSPFSMLLSRHTRRREFLGLVVGAVAWPSAVHAQSREQSRRVGVLLGSAADDPRSQAQLARFLQSMQQLGWTVGKSLTVDFRWTAGKVEDARKLAAELLGLAPDVVL